MAVIRQQGEGKGGNMVKLFVFVVLSLLLISCTQPAVETPSQEQAAETTPSLPQQEAAEQPEKAGNNADEINQLLADDIGDAIADLDQLK